MTIDRSTLSQDAILAKYILPRIAFEPNTGCWIWLGHLHHAGYGTARLPRIDKAGWSTQSVARVVYESAIGRAPDGHLVRNTCRLQCCVNPDHHELIARKKWLSSRTTWKRFAGRTACSEGHELSERNTFENHRGQRKCRKCQAAYERKHREKRRAEDWRKFGEFLESAKLADKRQLGPARYYVYHLIDPFSETVFYVGKGSGSRVLQHEQDVLANGISVNQKKDAAIRSILARGGEVQFAIVRRNLTEAHALWLEQQEIDRIGIDRLTNRASVSIPKRFLRTA